MLSARASTFARRSFHDLASLVWAANAAAIELHPFLGTTDDLLTPTAAVLDLDPGPPDGLLDAA